MQQELDSGTGMATVRHQEGVSVSRVYYYISLDDSPISINTRLGMSGVWALYTRDTVFWHSLTAGSPTSRCYRNHILHRQRLLSCRENGGGSCSIPPI